MRLLLSPPQCVCLVYACSCITWPCMLLIYLHANLQQDLFSHRRQIMYPHLWASTVCSSLGCYCTLLCLCLYYVSWISAVLWVCLHPSLREYACVECICVSVNTPPFFFFFFLSFSLVSGCLCVSVLNDYSHRINNNTIKQLQLSTCVKPETEKVQKKQNKRWKRQDKRVQGVRKNGKCDEDHFSGWSRRLEALPRPSALSLGRPCSPLSALGERKRTKDLLLGPDLYTFLVLFFSPRPLGHTKGL